MSKTQLLCQKTEKGRINPPLRFLQNNADFTFMPRRELPRREPRQQRPQP